MNVSDYKLETLRRDAEFVLYRGLAESQTDKSPSRLLILVPVLERPAPETLRRMEHEFSLKAELDPDWAVRPLALTQHQGRSVLVLEDPGGEPLDRLARRADGAGAVFAAGGSVSAAAVGRLHGRGLIHKEIKPANVLVNPCDRPGLADGLWHRLAAAARAPVARAARDHRRHTRLHGPGTDRADESVDRFPQRSLCARRDALRDADRQLCRSRRPIRWSGCTATSPGSRCRPPSG